MLPAFQACQCRRALNPAFKSRWRGFTGYPGSDRRLPERLSRVAFFSGPLSLFALANCRSDCARQISDQPARNTPARIFGHRVAIEYADRDFDVSRHRNRRAGKWSDDPGNGQNVQSLAPDRANRTDISLGLAPWPRRPGSTRSRRSCLTSPHRQRNGRDDPLIGLQT